MKNQKNNDIIFGSSRYIRVQVAFYPLIYQFFIFGSRRLCSKPKMYGLVWVGLLGWVSFCEVYWYLYLLELGKREKCPIF